MPTVTLKVNSAVTSAADAALIFKHLAGESRKLCELADQSQT